MRTMSTRSGISEWGPMPEVCVVIDLFLTTRLVDLELDLDLDETYYNDNDLWLGNLRMRTVRR